MATAEGPLIFVELTFPTGGPYPLELTSAVRVLPDTPPFAAPVPKRAGSGGPVQ